ncbi:hypothetical protein OAO87_01885, partial [bacterium]|nr:hypothetical protein [bacterium]
MSAMPRGRQLAAFAWVWGGGTSLMTGAGHMAVGGPPDRQADRGHHPASVRPWRMHARAIGRSGRGESCAGSNGCVCVAAAADWPSM